MNHRDPLIERIAGGAETDRFSFEEESAGVGRVNTA
jgi:hypothetical protein